MNIKEIIDMVSGLDVKDNVTYAQIKSTNYLIVSKSAGEMLIYESLSNGTFSSNLSATATDKKSVFKEIAKGKEATIKTLMADYSKNHAVGKIHLDSK